MCGRFTQQRPTAELAEIFEAEPLVDDPGGHFNVAPTDEAAVVVERGDRRAVTAYRWGLIPSWADDPRIASRLFNARAETVATSGTSSGTASDAGAASSRSTGSTSGDAETVGGSPSWRPGTTGDRSPWPGSGRPGATR